MDIPMDTPTDTLMEHQMVRQMEIVQVLFKTSKTQSLT